MMDVRDLEIPYPEVKQPVVMLTHDRKWCLVQLHTPSMGLVEYQNPLERAERVMWRSDEPMPFPPTDNHRFVLEWKQPAKGAGWYLMIQPPPEVHEKPTLTKKVGMRRPGG